MLQTNEMTGQDNGREGIDGISRRRFLASTAMGLVAGMTVGVSGVFRTADAGGFAEYLKYDGLGLADLVRRKEVSPQELLDAAIARIEAINPKINAVVTKMYDEARKTISKGLPDGPFMGVPFLLKDLAATYAGVRLTSGSRLFAEYVPNYDNELVKRYKRAGLVILGRTNTPEFGLNVTTESVLLGPARNPWDVERSTGGSSGGSAAAVTTRMVPIAHGNDGGGSIRIPSSCCGVFGMKPSRGRTPNGPEFGEVWEGFAIDHALSISVRDSAALLDATSAPEIGAPYGIPAPARPFVEEVGADPGRLRIAFFTKGASAAETHPDCVAAVKDVAKLCESLGHTVEEAAPKIDYEALQKAFMVVVSAHTAAMLDQIGQLIGKKITADMVEPWTWSVAESGWKASAADLAGTKAIINIATRTVAGFLTQYDVILTPTLGAPPPKLGYFDTVNLSFDELSKRIFDFIPFTWLHNVTGLPAMSVPLYWNAQGLPIGVQFAGRYADEATLYRLAGQLEKARPWRGKVPPMAL
jgi:Asp-tRNA(Asn)/Glu-tRNA(Gln) amidotransferase A subunit family amidase